jgi:DNA-binding transcriptional ArsR family regulator
METLNIPKKPDGSRPLPDRELLLIAISHSTRWEMLKALSAGEALMVSELATIAGCSDDMAGKHLATLKRAGLVVQGRGRLYALPKQHQPVPGEPLVDFGHCVLRLDAAAQK